MLETLVAFALTLFGTAASTAAPNDGVDALGRDTGWQRVIVVKSADKTQPGKLLPGGNSDRQSARCEGSSTSTLAKLRRTSSGFGVDATTSVVRHDHQVSNLRLRESRRTIVGIPLQILYCTWLA